MEHANEPPDGNVSLLDAASRDDVRFLAAIADIVRDLIELDHVPVPLENFGRDEPPVWTAYQLVPLAPKDLN